MKPATTGAGHAADSRMASAPVPTSASPTAIATALAGRAG